MVEPWVLTMVQPWLPAILRNSITVRNHGLAMVIHGHHDHGQPWLTMVPFLRSMVNHGHHDHDQPCLTVMPFLKSMVNHGYYGHGQPCSTVGTLLKSKVDQGQPCSKACVNHSHHGCYWPWSTMVLRELSTKICIQGCRLVHVYNNPLQ